MPVSHVCTSVAPLRYRVNDRLTKESYPSAPLTTSRHSKRSSSSSIRCSATGRTATSTSAFFASPVELEACEGSGRANSGEGAPSAFIRRTGHGRQPEQCLKRSLTRTSMRSFFVCKKFGRLQVGGKDASCAQSEEDGHYALKNFTRSQPQDLRGEHHDALKIQRHPA